MFRSLVLGLAALALVVGGIIAEEHKGKLKKIDTSAKKLTIETKAGEKTVDYADSIKVVGKDKEGKEIDIDLSKAAKMVDKGAEKGKSPFVTIVTEKKGDKEVATTIKMGGGKKKDNK